MTTNTVEPREVFGAVSFESDNVLLVRHREANLIETVDETHFAELRVVVVGGRGGGCGFSFFALQSSIRFVLWKLKSARDDDEETHLVNLEWVLFAVGTTDDLVWQINLERNLGLGVFKQFGNDLLGQNDRERA